tara:strand:+ start:1439 stop:2179 length:741 start_codon:yes stop_codon:yes gene_type:complete
LFSKVIKQKKEYLYKNKDEFYDNKDEDFCEDWRESKTGDWILTDDGQVCRVLKRGIFSNGKEYIRTLLGSYPIRENIYIGGKPADDIYRFTKSTKPRHSNEKIESPTRREVVFAKYCANGMPPEQAYLRIFPTNNSKYAQTASNALLKTERIQKMVSEEVKQMLGKVGIDEQYLLSQAKSIIDNFDGRDSDKLRAIEMLMKISGMFPNDKKTESLTVFQGFTSEQLKELEPSTVKTIGHAEKTITE